jgi:hypothetical protein
MSGRTKLKALAKVTHRAGRYSPEVEVPRPATALLGARGGDTLVFEEGSTWAAERAAAAGPYIILRCATPGELAEKEKPATEAPADAPVTGAGHVPGELSAEAERARRLLGGN